MARYLIDTDVMIDVSRGSGLAATFVDSLENITISIITAHELIVGARNHRDTAAIDGLIRTFPIHADLRAEITGLAYARRKKQFAGVWHRDAADAYATIGDRRSRHNDDSRHVRERRLQATGGRETQGGHESRSACPV